MFRWTVLFALLAFPVWANIRIDARIEPLRRTFSAVPVAWHGAIGEFLEASIDAEMLYGRLLVLSRLPPILDDDSALRLAAQRADASDRLTSAERRQEAARRYYQLESVLSAFVSDRDLGGLRSAADRLVPDSERAALVEAAKRTADVLTGLRPEGAHLPAAGEFASDDATMDLRVEIDLPYIREILPRMRYDPSGAVAFQPDGFPDEESYSAAYKAAALLRDDPEARWVRGEDRELIRGLAKVFESTEAIIFSGGNELAKTVRYIEPRAGGLNMTILRYVETGQYSQGPFWVSSNDRTLEAPEGFADVDAQTAKGPFLLALKHEEFVETFGRKPADRKELDEFRSKARSRFFWAAKAGSFGVPDIQGMRVRVNSDWKGNDRTLEVMAPVGFEPDGEVRWKGFFFKKIEGRWVSGAPTKLGPDAKCILCHFRLDARGKPRHTPLPHDKLKTREDYLKVGYKDTRLLDRYLAIGHRALEYDGDLDLPRARR